ncbi:MAG TPA: hypothetical protein VJI15_05330 [Candidatus Nanoarchaeia archaeon]|nr:hypothetical protein [Candidatus Nanoarchaeia archaeon]
MSLDLFMEREVRNVGSNTIIIDRDDPLTRGWGFFESLEGRLRLLSWSVSNLPREQTVEHIEDYLVKEGMDDVTVRAGHSRVFEDMSRLFTDEKLKDISIMGRIFLGIPATFYQGLLAKLFRADHYNPFTKTAIIYSDVPAIARHELGHAKDFSERTFPTWYALSRSIPGIDLFQEGKATMYAHESMAPKDKWQTGRYLVPAYATYVGGYLSLIAFWGTGSAPAAGVVGLAALAAGHIIGNMYAGLRKAADYVSGRSKQADYAVAPTMEIVTEASPPKESFLSRVGGKLKAAARYVTGTSTPRPMAVGAM